jgi:hypothetical protein
MTTSTTSTTNYSVGTITGTANISVGTITPRLDTGSYVASITPGSAAPLPAGAVVSFYQTLPASGEVPYVIEETALDPFNRKLTQSLSAATIDSGTFVSSGGTVTLTTAVPVETKGVYRVGATASLFTDGSLATTVSGTTPVSVPTLTVASGAVADSLSVNVSKTPGAYDQGQIIIAHDGTVVAAAPLNSVLGTAPDGSITIDGIPGGSSGTPFADGVYYISVLTWRPSDPSAPLHQQSYATPVDLRNGSVSGVAITID